ncbi:MAG: DUF1616 domain-containing protein [Chloroflexaceae bacterium]|jgi:hypothetical protein|nr:DUF1616 domain-containing protein [Chloroflexaceae bacterium]
MTRLFQRSPDLWLAIGLVFVLGLLLLVPMDAGLLHVLVGVPFVLLLPGYTLLAALQPQQHGLPVQRFMLSVAVSLALVVLVGLFINAVGLPVTMNSWFVVLAGVVVGAALVALARRGNSPIPRFPAFEPLGAVIIALAAVAVGMAVNMAAASDSSRPTTNFTQLWATGSAAAGFEIGVKNGEGTPVTYRVVLVDANGAALQSWDAVSLNHGESWQVQVQPAGRAEVHLFRSDAPDQRYRRVELQPGS